MTRTREGWFSFQVDENGLVKTLWWRIGLFLPFIFCLIAAAIMAYFI